MQESDLKGYLVDTSIISAFAPGRPSLPQNLADWFRDHADQLYLSVITVEEIQKGASKLIIANHGISARANGLLIWLERLLEIYGDRVLPVDSEVARYAGVFEAEATAKGRHPGFADVLIAATAKAHELVLLTANMKHFEPLDCICRNPLDE